MSEPLQTRLLADFPELSSLSREDLQDLLNDRVYFQAVFHSLPRVKAMYQAQSELGLANETIAANNLGLQEQLYALRSQTQDAFNDAKSLEARWRELEKEQKEVYQRFNPQFLLMRLRHSITAQDDASEALASSFVQQSSSTITSSSTPNSSSGTGTPVPTTGAKELDDFIKEYKDLRKTYHKRVIWGDRWSNGQVVWRDD